MPIASFRSWLGFAKENPPTRLLAATAAGATTVTTTTTAVPASSTIFFIDGVNSESVAVSAGGGTASLTTAATTYAHNVNCPIIWQLTASVGPVAYTPVTSLDPADTIGTVDDTGLRGSNVSSYGVVQVSGESDISLGGDLIPDQFGYLLGSIFGAVDFVSSTTNTHTFAGNNTSASNGQPTALDLYVYNGYNTRMYAGCKASELTIKYDPAQLLSWTAKFKGFLSGVVATPTPSFSSLTPQGAWQTTITIGGSTASVSTVMSADLTFTRAVDVVPTLDGNQNPYVIWSEALTVAGNLSLVMEDDTYLNMFLNNTQPATVLTMTNGTGAAQVGVTVQLTKTNFMSGWKAKMTGGKGFVEVSGPISGVANVTDANTAGGGYSPARVVLRNVVPNNRYQ